MANIVITGGAGYIGAQLSLELSRKHEITVLDRMINPQVKSQFEKKSIIFKKADITKKETLPALLKGSDAIIHMAVMHEVEPGVRKPNCSSSFEKLFRNNVFGAKYLIDAFEVSDIPQFINISSYYVYGNDTPLIREDVCPQPDTIRGVTKLAVEKFCRLSYDRSGKNISTLRLPIVYGTSVNMRWEAVANKFVKNAIMERPINIYRGGGQMRNFLHMDDSISAIGKAVGNEKISGQEINIGSLDSLSIAQLSGLVEKAGKKYGIAASVEKHGEGGTGKLDYDISKAKELLGFVPGHYMEDSLGEMFELGLETLR